MRHAELSIIVASLRPGQLEKCLESIEHHTANVDYEVVVIAPFPVCPRPRLVYIPEIEPIGMYVAVNMGFARAQGKYIINIPDDARATLNWAANMLAFMKPHDTEIFEGNFRHFDLINGERPEPGYYGKLYAPFFCIRKAVAIRIGGLMRTCYHRFFGDPDLSMRVWFSNGAVATCPDAWVYHNDCKDRVYQNGYDKYFATDRDTFMWRWQPVYGRSREVPVSLPVKRMVPFALPPTEGLVL